MRYETFKSNLQFIEKHNQKNNDLVLKLNKFGAMSNEEYQQRYLDENININELEYLRQEKFQEQSELVNVDWKQRGYVGPTQDMGECNASYAFATIGALQGFSQINNLSSEKLFSQQQIISCSTTNLGCEGGNVLRAYSYVKENGLTSQNKYPYTSGNGSSGTCQYNNEDQVFQLENYALNPQNSQIIAEQLQNTTMTVGVDASSLYWQFYSQGVLSSFFCGSKINFAVTLYGVNYESDGSSYWMVQNQVGEENWGEKGYGKIKNSQDNTTGTCGINQFAVYPINQQEKNQTAKY